MPLISTKQTGLPPGVTGGGGQAYTRDVQAGELAGNQMTGLLAGGGKYIDNARSRGEEFAQSRLLGNSSIAAGAGERAAIEGAMPMAMQQAGAEQQAASENLGYLNQYEIADRANASAENRARIGADATLGAARIGANASMRNLEASLAFQGQQMDLDRAQQIFMADLGFNQELQGMAFAHDIDLDRLAASAFYDMEQMSALQDIGTRQQGMQFMMGAYTNYSQNVANALTGDFDAAAQGRLIAQFDNQLSNSVAFGQQLFGAYPPFEFDFSRYGGG